MNIKVTKGCGNKKKRVFLALFMLFVASIGIGAFFINHDQKDNGVSIGKWVYDINYELDGGTLPNNTPKTYDNRKDITLVEPTKKGYTFVGWKMDIKPESWEDGFISLETGEDGLGSTGDGFPNAKRTDFIKLKKGTTYIGHAKPVGGSIARVRLYNENKKYIASHDLAQDIGFTITPENDQYARLLVLDSTVTNVEDVYFSVNDYVNVISKGTQGNISLTAEWAPNNYTIKLHGNGGTLVEGKSDTIQATYDEGVMLPSNTFTCVGIPTNILSYNTKPDGSGVSYNINDVSVKNLTSVNNATIDLYAQWYPTLDFNSIYYKGRLGNNYYSGENIKSFHAFITKPDGSIITRFSEQGDFGNKIEKGDIIELKFIDYRFGYQFNKFLIQYSNDNYNSAINKGITILNQDETSIKFRIDKTYNDTRSIISLGWYNEEIPYNISYDLKGGSLPSSQTNPIDYNVRSENITLNNPTKTGYTFQGWEEVIRPTQWHEGDLSNKQGDPNGGNICESTRGAYYSDFVSVKAGNKYKSDGTAVGARYYDKKFNYIAYVTDALNNGYTVPQDGYIRFVMPNYETNKDTLIPRAKLTNMTPKKDMVIEKGSVGNREYTAKWEAKELTYNINYKSSSGKSLGTSTVKGKYGSTVEVTAPAKNGYTTPAKQSVKFDSTTPKTITFTYPLIDYKIAYDNSGEKVHFGDVNHSDITLFPDFNNPGERDNTYNSYIQNDYKTFVFQVYDKDLKWYFDGVHRPEYDGINVINVPDDIKDKRVAIRVEFSSATKEYQNNNGWIYIDVYNCVGCQDKILTNYNIESIDKLHNIEGENNTKFVGYYDNPSFTGNPITTMEGLYGNKVLYPKFKELPYNITYNLDGGTLPSDAPKTFYSSQGLDRLPIPTKDGYNFLGWKEVGNTNYVTSIPKGSTGDKTFTAEYRPVVLIEFTLQHEGEYPSSFITAEQGMNWEEFVNSKYNNYDANLAIDEQGRVYQVGRGCILNVNKNDKIKDMYGYTFICAH